jgi:hypothetical protein
MTHFKVGISMMRQENVKPFDIKINSIDPLETSSVI